MPALISACCPSKVFPSLLVRGSCSGFEAGSYLRLIDFVYHSTLGLRVIKKKKKKTSHEHPSGLRVRVVFHTPGNSTFLLLLYYSQA